MLIEHVNSFVESAVDYRRQVYDLGMRGDEPHLAPLVENMQRTQPGMQRICAAFDDDAVPRSAEFSGDDHLSMAAPAQRLLGYLRTAERLSVALASDDVPALGDLHAWVQESATSLWRNGHYRNAVQAAATQVDIQLQAKLGRDDVSGVALAREAFRLDPPEHGKKRLRFAGVGSEASPTYVTVHEGAMNFGVGVTQVIRNTATHRVGPISEQVALEQLTVVSYWARLIDGASLEPQFDDPAPVTDD